MRRVLLGIVFLALPLVELALLITTGRWIGVWPVLAIIVGTGLLGAHVLVRQSWTALRQMQEALTSGQPPVASVLDGGLLVLAGTLLITPGLLSDGVGLLLLVPPIRHAIGRWLVRRMLGGAQVHAAPGSEPAGSPHRPRGDGPIIEGEFERLDEKAPGPHRPGGRDHV